MFYKQVVRRILFLFQAETVHRLAVIFLKLPGVKYLLRRLFYLEHPSLQRKLFGLTFKNPVGLAAGFDKNAELTDEMAALGFSFIEIGTVTPQPQPGNPKPRIFRLVEDQALINRMGFNNGGVEKISRNLGSKSRRYLIAGNIGKNKITPNSRAMEDYRQCYLALHEQVDFFVVNVSSPNTPHLRELQDKEPLTQLLQELKNLNSRQPEPRPILLKIAPDLNNSQLDDIIEIVKETGIDGVVATNTTIGRENLRAPIEKIEAVGEGGLSGVPLHKRATEVIRYLHQNSGGAFPIIGVGGIHSPQDALEKLRAGASLVELYTGFIFEGPGLVRRINRAILKENLPKPPA